jgi:hypothetical protein
MDNGSVEIFGFVIGFGISFAYFQSFGFGQNFGSYLYLKL